MDWYGWYCPRFQKGVHLILGPIFFYPRLAWLDSSRTSQSSRMMKTVKGGGPQLGPWGALKRADSEFHGGSRFGSQGVHYIHYMSQLDQEASEISKIPVLSWPHLNMRTLGKSSGKKHVKITLNHQAAAVGMGQTMSTWFIHLSVVSMVVLLKSSHKK